MFQRALKTVAAGCVTSINLYNCETGAIIYVTVHYTKNITLLAVACGPCCTAGMYCSSWLFYINIVQGLIFILFILHTFKAHTNSQGKLVQPKYLMAYEFVTCS